MGDPILLRPNPVRAELFDEHTRAVGLVTGAGVEPPPEWVRLRDRFLEFRGLGGATPLRDRLVAAVLNDADADILALRAAALAEQLDHGKLVSAVRAAAVVRLQELYAPSPWPYEPEAYEVDPEDANYQPAEPVKKPRLGRLAP